MNSTTMYLIGYFVVILGVALGAHLLGLSRQWIAVIVIILMGLGITSAVRKTRQPEE